MSPISYQKSPPCHQKSRAKDTGIDEGLQMRERVCWCSLCCRVVQCELECGAVFIEVCWITVEGSAAAESRKDEGTDEGAYVRRRVSVLLLQAV